MTKDMTKQRCTQGLRLEAINTLTPAHTFIHVVWLPASAYLMEASAPVMRSDSIVFARPFMAFVTRLTWRWMATYSRRFIHSSLPTCSKPLRASTTFWAPNNLCRGKTLAPISGLIKPATGKKLKTLSQSFLEPRTRCINGVGSEAPFKGGASRA